METTMASNVVPSIDRLSVLPDDILCHILSFLPTKISVATSILARRWRFLWAHVPNLDFESENNVTKTNIPDIIHRVMLLHRVKNLNTFRLSRVHCSEYQLETWITIAIERNVRNLDFHLTTVLPRCLFTCKTLVDLRLNRCEGIPFSPVVSLPSLKKLQFSSVQNQYQSQFEKALSHLLSGCPVLDELIIEKDVAVDHDFCCCDTPARTIKKLTIKFLFDHYNKRWKINVPGNLLVEEYTLEQILCFAYHLLDGNKYMFEQCASR